MQITSTELEKGSNTKQSQEKLPLLLRRLILNNLDNKYIVKMNIPGGDSIGKPGVDGYIETLENCILGDACTYIVECGQNFDYKNKFNEDLCKRSASSGSSTDRVFVFISTRKIKDKECIINKAKNKWPQYGKDIKIFDADDIETGLNQDYATNAGMCDILEKPFDNIYDFDYKGENGKNSTIIPLDENIILAREHTFSQEIKCGLLEKKGLIEVRACSKRESLLFLLASIMKIPSIETREEVKSKIVIVEDKTQGIRLVEDGISRKLILVPMFGVPEGLHSLLAKQFTIYIPLTKNEPFQTNNKIDLDNICNYLLEPILDSLLEHNKLFEIKNKIFSNFNYNDILVLQRILRKDNAPLPLPAGAEKENANILLFLSMFSSGNNYYKKDIKLIEETLNLSYKDIKTKLITFLNIAESPIQQIDSIFQVSNLELIVECVGSYLTSEYLDKLLDSAQKILSTIDYNIDNKGLFNIDINKAETCYSEELKNSVSLGLALFANREDYFSPEIHIKQKINNTINKIFKDSDYKLGSFLNPYIDLLFESAPNAMIINTANLIKDGISIKKMIENSYFAIGGGCFYSGILFGIESIVGVPSFLREASELLLKMQQIWVEGSQYINSPLSSLSNIYDICFPQTSASFEDRKKVLSALISTNKYNNILEMLFVDVLFRHIVCETTAKPKYLKYHTVECSDKDISDMREFIFNNLLKIMDISNNGYLLLDRYNDLSYKYKERLYNKLQILDLNKISDDKKVKIKNSIKNIIFLYDTSNKQNDIYKREEKLINDLVTVNQSITFKEEYKNYLSLFATSSCLNNDEYIKALNSIIEKEGIQGIINFINELQSDDINILLYKNILSEVKLLDFQIKDLLSKFNISKHIDIFVCRWLAENFNSKVSVFFNQYGKDEGSDDIKQQILFTFSPTKQLGEGVKEKNLNELYGSKIIFEKKFSNEEVEIVTSNLKEYDNYKALLIVVFINKNTVSVDTIIYALKSFRCNINSMYKAFILELFNTLYKHDISKDTLIMLELKYINLWNNGKLPQTIKKEITDPQSDLFYSLVRMYYGKNQTNESDNGDNVAKVKQHLYMVIIKTSSHFCFENVEVIPIWFENNKRRFQKLDESDITKKFYYGTGNILGLCPKDNNDEIGPCKEIRNLIEKEENDDLEQGIFNQKIKSLGFRNISPDGSDMGNLYNEYTDYSNKLKFDYPRTSKIVELLAEWYKQNAKIDKNCYKLRI